MADRDFCFVVMPFARKTDASGMSIDFDAIYTGAIRPAIEAAGLDPIRADAEKVGGIIQKPMFERLVLCKYAVADLTTANANVFYELGVRHAVRPWSTVLLFAEGGRLPFDVADLRAFPYRLEADGTLSDAAAEALRKGITERLVEAQEAAAHAPVKDSPLFQLLDGYPEVEIPHDKTDVFREQVEYSQKLQARITEARGEGAEALRALEKELQPLDRKESGVVIDLFLSYRDAKAYDDMVRLVDDEENGMPRVLATTTLVQEQLAFALNRRGDSERAEQVLRAIIDKRGPSSETNGLLGRVYKDRWEAARKAGKTFQADGYRDQAIEAYVQGFEANWTDAYPGVNAVTLMEMKDEVPPRQKDLIPVVAFAVERKIARGKADYWDYATLLELAVLAGDRKKAGDALRKAAARVRAGWEVETTARNLSLIYRRREERGEDAAWIRELEANLLSTAPDPAPAG